MAATLDIHDLEQAREHAARSTCGGCGKVGTLAAFEVKKDSPNQGRLFARCRHCGHFDWLTAARTTDPELEQAQAKARPCPKCGKGRRAQRVRKEGPNQGRLFLVCADPACDSFEWASPATGPRAAPAIRPAPTEGQRTEKGLLDDILDHPDDDTPRLVYANWLDDHDQPLRAELIRVQIEAARLPEDNPARARLEARARGILDEQKAAWIGELNNFSESYHFDRGLVGEVEITAEQFAQHADELLRVAPAAVLRVHVAGWQDAKVLVSCRRLLSVRRLALLGERVGGAGARILAESPLIANLKALSLVGQSLGQPGAGALAGSRYLSNLEELDLTSNNLSRSAVPILASSSNLTRLRKLILAQNLLRDSDVRALANSPHFKELRELDLSWNAITNEAVEALSIAPLLGRLRRLKLSGCQVTPNALYWLRRSSSVHKDLIVEC
jgi:uncharacterized protein (TIGR02996 family)